MNRTLTPTFEADETVISQRIRLSRLDTHAFAAMSPWLAASLAPEWALEALSNVVEAGAATLITEASSGAPIGVAVVRLDTPQTNAASIVFISIEPEQRYRGLGGEAALALERHLRRRFAVEQVFAPVPDWRGLAVYFWLRLGYRPLTLAEAPLPLTGLAGEKRPGIWLHRATD